jgi:hypothetical protein
LQIIFSGKRGETMNHKLHIQRPVMVVLVFWGAIWVLAIATWMYDSAGYTVGMPMPVFFLQLLAPLLAGVVLGWGKSRLWPGMKAGMIGGALFGIANLVGQLIWGGVLYLMGRIPPESPFTFVEGIFEALEFLVLFMMTGLILGAVGGLLGFGIAKVLHYSDEKPKPAL